MVIFMTDERVFIRDDGGYYASERSEVSTSTLLNNSNIVDSLTIAAQSWDDGIIMNTITNTITLNGGGHA